MNSCRLKSIVRTVLNFLLAAGFGGCTAPSCEPDPEESFPEGSIWRFEMKQEETTLKEYLPGQGCPYHDGWVCEGHQMHGDPLYLTNVFDFSGTFKVEPAIFEGSGFSLTAQTLFAGMRVTLPGEKYKATYTEPYGTIMHSSGQHSVDESHHTDGVTDWFSNDNHIEDDTFHIAINVPSDTWMVYGYYWNLHSNTQPGRGGIGAWWNSDSEFLSSLWGPYWEAPLENGTWTEEEGPTDWTDSGGYTYLGFHLVRTLRLNCIENCKNFDCSQPCWDGNDCTEDTCVEGKGCKFKPRTGTCSDNECFEEGTCQDGVCEQNTPIDCDDGDPCTKHDCHPLHGCTYDADNKKLRNEDPHDCWQVICLNGIEQTVPDPTETPVQGPDDDCYREVCIAGQGEVSIPTDRETPPQNSPDDCMREVCMTGVGLQSVPIGTEPGCDCQQDWQCEDGNVCTRETCDQANNVCVNHGPDDSLTPPEEPANCKEEKCEGGQIVKVPDDNDPPMDVDPYDCEQQYCENGLIETGPDTDEHVGCTEP